jgi:hypothetical protein
MSTIYPAHQFAVRRQVRMLNAPKPDLRKAEKIALTELEHAHSRGYAIGCARRFLDDVRRISTGGDVA